MSHAAVRKYWFETFRPERIKVTVYTEQPSRARWLLCNFQCITKPPRFALLAGRALQAPSVPAEQMATIVMENATSAAASFLGALQSSSEKVTVTASNGMGLFAQCVCQSAISGLQAQKLVSIDVAGASASLGNDTAGSTAFQNLVEVLELDAGDFKASTSSFAEAQATGVQSTTVGLNTVTATTAVQNASVIDGQGRQALGKSTAGGDEKETTFSASSVLFSGGSSRTTQTNSATVTTTNLPADAVTTPFQTVVVSTGVSVQYVARSLVTRDYVEVSVHTTASATSSIDLIFPDPKQTGRVYKTRIEGLASLSCDCSANATFVNGTDFAPLAIVSGADEEHAGSTFATDPLQCNIYGSSPNMVSAQVLNLAVRFWSVPADVNPSLLGVAGFVERRKCLKTGSG
jgi:hypothetical protein